MNTLQQLIENVERKADAEYEVISSPHPRAIVKSLRDNPNFVKCPRCWHYHTVLLNFDSLCDRCCHVLLEGWPDHPSVKGIKDNWASQRVHFSRPVEPVK